MKKPVVMLVDTDENYLMPIELKILEELEEVELMVISDTQYLKEYFSIPRKIDILIINERLYDTQLQRHTIGNTFILIEDSYRNEIVEQTNIHTIYKYTSVKEIFSQVFSNGYIEVNKGENDAKVIMVYSPAGGSGKTTVSLGLAATLKKLNRNVIYINTENIQSFNFLLENNIYCRPGLDKYLVSKDDSLSNFLDESIYNKPFDYVLPFKQSLSSLNIRFDEIKFLIEKLKETRKYQYIIVDTSNEFNKEKTMLMAYCNKVLILSEQNKSGAIKLNRLKSNIDCSDSSKFIFVCNKYKEEENYLIKDEFIRNCNITEYINFFNEDDINIENLSRSTCFNKLTYMFI